MYIKDAQQELEGYNVLLHTPPSGPFRCSYFLFFWLQTLLLTTVLLSIASSASLRSLENQTARIHSPVQLLN